MSFGSFPSLPFNQEEGVFVESSHLLTVICSSFHFPFFSPPPVRIFFFPLIANHSLRRSKYPQPTTCLRILNFFFQCCSPFFFFPPLKPPPPNHKYLPVFNLTGLHPRTCFHCFLIPFHPPPPPSPRPPVLPYLPFMFSPLLSKIYLEPL